jgi:hypothetical protein
MKIKCLIDHCDVVFSGKVYEVLEFHQHSGQVRVEGSDGYPVWLSLDYHGTKEYEECK